MNRRSGAQLRVLAPEGEVELAGALRKQDALRVGLQDAQGHQAGRDLLPLCVGHLSGRLTADGGTGTAGRRRSENPDRARPAWSQDGYLLAGGQEVGHLGRIGKLDGQGDHVRRDR